MSKHRVSRWEIKARAKKRGHQEKDRREKLCAAVRYVETIRHADVWTAAVLDAAENWGAR